MVAGKVHDAELWSRRLGDNIKWLRNRVSENIDDIDVVVSFGI